MIDPLDIQGRVRAAIRAQAQGINIADMILDVTFTSEEEKQDYILRVAGDAIGVAAGIIFLLAQSAEEPIESLCNDLFQLLDLIEPTEG